MIVLIEVYLVKFHRTKINILQLRYDNYLLVILFYVLKEIKFTLPITFMNNKYGNDYYNLLIQVSEYLFRDPNKTEGFDLVSFDLERGRDFGEPSYNKFRQLCGLSEAKTFDDFTDQITKKVNTYVKELHIT